jgi:hypothetical protein
VQQEHSAKIEGALSHRGLATQTDCRTHGLRNGWKTWSFCKAKRRRCLRFEMAYMPPEQHHLACMCPPGKKKRNIGEKEETIPSRADKSQNRVKVSRAGAGQHITNPSHTIAEFWWLCKYVFFFIPLFLLLFYFFNFLFLLNPK